MIDDFWNNMFCLFSFFYSDVMGCIIDAKMDKGSVISLWLYIDGHIICKGSWLSWIVVQVILLVVYNQEICVFMNVFCD